ncbi:MAG: CoA activase [Candidatus Magnetomorum sp.]|nr:CoA activase [Candidatus Magnetomorum sp.]
MKVSNILGIDIGSVSISIVEISSDKKLVNTAYEFHKGDIRSCLKKMLQTFNFENIARISTTSSTSDTLISDGQYNNQVSVISAAKTLHGHFDSILVVGGEKFALLLFDEHGNYQSCKTNTSCAAGTGSFLDQQARRLNLETIQELSDIAYKNSGKIPMIASRCAVFAKTDLIHAQQEGYSMGEISDALCYGLAKNIVDTLFCGLTPHGKILFCGGVAKNKAVKEHIEALTGVQLVVDDVSHLYGALGAAFCLLEELVATQTTVCLSTPVNPETIIAEIKMQKKLFYPALELKLSEFPSFESIEKYTYSPVNIQNKNNDIEIDIYKEISKGETVDAWIGVDIGSTSTKAVLMDIEKTVIAGFYTRTAGNPLQAICSIFESIDDIIKRKKIILSIKACGTTGSGRKFIGKIIGADRAIDEITAHARAAYELNPDVDTIIEIGGQDAKFTTLKKGTVTFSTMNNVCAAGTGSFIEEQARKLGCNISDYSERTESVQAPLSSDRCTVFMERDLNHYLSEGYHINEVLASVLHSVRENYLIKVATESSIGNCIFFQGATAKNRSLIAAFEQRLGKPIRVSSFCHLTGALGTALILMDEHVNQTTFHGVDIYKKDIPVTSEICELCNNNCKISVADIDHKKVAYGFLCGRDYDTQQYVNNKKSGFDMIKERKKVVSQKLNIDKNHYNKDLVIGIPAALHLYEDLPYWKYFFDLLSIKTVTSETYKDAVKRGKNLSETEFCAPATAMYGHVKYLLDKTDYIFLPFYLEDKTKNARRQYCYYTQYMPSIMAKYERKKVLTPLIKYLYTNFSSKNELYKMLKSIGLKANLYDTSSAFDKAFEFKKMCMGRFREMYTEETIGANDVNVVFLGRPYTVLSPVVNNGIPDIFSSLGIKTFYQDMVPLEDEDTRTIDPLLNDIHWKYPAKILQVAEKIATSENVYPVYITSFKCTPDSFCLKYFKELMTRHEKPYLILELDEHDSSVGYETRIEAAIRSFRNDRMITRQRKTMNYSSLFLKSEKNLTGKNLVMPNWDAITCRFLVATLKREGVNAYIIEETDATIQQSIKFNTGQRIPANAIAQGFVETIEKNGLNPEDTLLWLSSSTICNLKLYPNYIQLLLSSYGNGMEKANIYQGELTFIDVSVRASINAYFSFMFGGLLRKMGCKIRPYELKKGTTDRVISKSVTILEDAFLGNRSKEDAISQIVNHFEWIDTEYKERPQVAIFGDLYVRDNHVMNQNLIHYIEDHGGEVITTPYTEIGKMIAEMYYKKWFNEGLYFNLFSIKALVSTMKMLEKKYFKYFERIIRESEHEYKTPPDHILSEYNVLAEHSGESMENLLKVYYLTQYYPEISLFVQASPAFCCPSIVTEAMKQEIERITSVPVVSITYDGTGGIKNENVIPYLKFPRVKRVING